MEESNVVKYKGVIVGELIADNSIRLFDNPEANEVKQLMSSSLIGISSRKIGEIDNGYIKNIKTIEHIIIENEK